MEETAPEFQLKNCTREEVDAFNNDLQELQAKHDVQIRVIPVFVPTTEGKFVIDTQLAIYRKVMLTAEPGKSVGVAESVIKKASKNSGKEEGVAKESPEKGS